MSALFHLAAAGFACIAIAFLPTPASAQMQVARASASAIVQQTRQIGVVMFAYACDNNGAYPTGDSSTEIFQKLIDGGYVNDSTLFYVKMPGKVAPTSNKLKPENVCFDVTVAVNNKSSDMVPLIYLTGFKVSFTPDSSAVPVSDAAKQAGGIPVFYKGDNALFRRADADGSVPHFVAPNFQDDAHYHQLTPDGPLQVMT